MFDTTVTVIGNLVDDPVMRRTSTGTPVVSFRIASSSRRLDRQSEQWVDGDPLFLRVSCWRDMATRTFGMLHRGDPVVIFGRLFTKNYTSGDQVRQSYELEARAMGPNMARVDASIARRDPKVVTYEVIGEVGADGAVVEQGGGTLVTARLGGSDRVPTRDGAGDLVRDLSGAADDLDNDLDDDLDDEREEDLEGVRVGAA
jgi:single-strand DNA-binding protein